jgi:hypothetical protein
LWARTERERRMPLDAEPYAGDDPRGLFVLRDENSLEGPLAIAVPPAAFADERLYRSHFATCPHAAQHRKAS